MKYIGDTIDIRMYVREYVASLGKIQEHVRNIIRGYSPAWEKRIDRIINKYPNSSKSKKDAVGLIIAIMQDDGTYSEIVYMFREYIQSWKRLERINMHIKYMPKQNVTTN